MLACPSVGLPHIATPTIKLQYLHDSAYRWPSRRTLCTDILVFRQSTNVQLRTYTHTHTSLGNQRASKHMQSYDASAAPMQHLCNGLACPCQRMRHWDRNSQNVIVSAAHSLQRTKTVHRMHNFYN